MMNVKNRQGRTQLHHCAEKSLTTNVKRLLLLRNIVVNVKDEYGWTQCIMLYGIGHMRLLFLKNGAE